MCVVIVMHGPCPPGPGLSQPGTHALAQGEGVEREGPTGFWAHVAFIWVPIIPSSPYYSFVALGVTAALWRLIGSLNVYSGAFAS